MDLLLDVEKWAGEKLVLASVQYCTIEGVKFQIMALDEEMVDVLQVCESYAEMLDYAAENGVTVKSVRMNTDEQLKPLLPELWAHKNVGTDCEPCIKYRLGEKVCEISGILEILEVQLEEEKQAEIEAKAEALKAQGHVDGDNDGDEYDAVKLESLDEDAALAS